VNWESMTPRLYVARSKTGGLWRIHRHTPKDWTITLNGIAPVARDGQPVVTGSLEGAQIVVDMMEQTNPLLHLPGGPATVPPDQLLQGPDTGGCLLKCFYAICSFLIFLVLLGAFFQQ
jgi:hypothetical protein